MTVAQKEEFCQVSPDQRLGKRIYTEHRRYEQLKERDCHGRLLPTNGHIWLGPHNQGFSDAFYEELEKGGDLVASLRQPRLTANSAHSGRTTVAKAPYGVIAARTHSAVVVGIR
jgi:hypothetical protein